MSDDTSPKPLTDEALKAAHSRLASEKPAAASGFPLTPIFQIGVFATMAFVAGVYLIQHSGKFKNTAYTSGSPAVEAKASPADEFNALVKKGEAAYAICSACHQPNGQGLPGAFPPLAGSEWVAGDPARMVKIILSGISGPITVKGNTYTSMMPGHAQLSDKDISAIATFVRTNEKWGNKASIVSEDQVKAIRAVNPPAPWTADALLKLYPLGDADKFPFVAPGGAAGDSHGAADPDTHAVDPAIVAKGKVLYAACAACHQPTGKGLPGVFPPLVGSDWLPGNPERTIALVLKGMMGPIEVSGQKYNGAMTPHEHLSDKDIAAILTYVKAGPDFGLNLHPVSPEQVKETREKFKGKTGMWSAEEILKLYPLGK